LPQLVAPSANLAVASTVASTTNDGSLSVPDVKVSLTSKEGNAKKWGSDVVFGGGEMDVDREELCMEEKRMMVGRYWNLVVRALVKRDGQ